MRVCTALFDGENIRLNYSVIPEDFFKYELFRPFGHRTDGQDLLYVGASYWRMSISVTTLSIGMSARTTRLVAKAFGIGIAAILMSGFILPQLLR